MRVEISPYDVVSYSSEEWGSVRRWILDRDFHTCQICGSKKNLCVHHKIYDDEKEIWDYADEDLITLCKDCHNDIHLDFGPVYPHWDKEQYYESRYYKQRLTK